MAKTVREQRLEELRKSGGPFIGPRGGKWADAQHTIPWKEGAMVPAGRFGDDPPKQAQPVKGDPRGGHFRSTDHGGGY